MCFRKFCFSVSNSPTRQKRHDRTAFPLFCCWSSPSPPPTSRPTHTSTNTHCCLLLYTYQFVYRSMFDLPSLQPKPPDSPAKILVWPPAQSSAGEQQQAGVHPRGDWQSQGTNGTGELRAETERVRGSELVSSGFTSLIVFIPCSLAPLVGRELQWDSGAASSDGAAPGLARTQHQEELPSHVAWGLVLHSLSLWLPLTSNVQ